jgi:hypothetical protein
MKSYIFLIFFVFSFFASIIFSTSAIALTPTLSCSACNTGTCICAISDCSNGTFDYYPSSDCSYIPYNEGVFTGGSFSFSISKTVYMKILCDNGNISACTTIYYVPRSTTTTTTQIYVMPSCQNEERICTAITPCCPGLKCQNGMCVRASTSSTTTTTTSTTTISKTSCPYDCCFGDANHFDKSCGSDSVCANNNCYVTTSTTTAAGYHISFSLIASSFVSIFLLIFLIYYVFGVVLGRRSARWVLKKR